MSVFNGANGDILSEIFCRLPADSFAFAACVNKSWNKACNRILSKPKMASALSLNPSLCDAVEEVLKKVLAEPIRPDFAIASIGKDFDVELVHAMISDRLSSKIPVITNIVSGGLIGEEATKTKQSLKEVRWEADTDEMDGLANLNLGIALTVGFMPGLVVDTIPLLVTKEVLLIDTFLIDIKHFTNLVSGGSTPSAMLFFGDHNFDMKPVMERIDALMPHEVPIVGDASCFFLCRNWHCLPLTDYWIGAVALVFATRKQKNPEIGETRFQVALSQGVMPFGPPLKVVAVKRNDMHTSRLMFRLEDHDQIMNAEELIEDILDQVGITNLYLGIIRPHKVEGYATSSEILRWKKTVSYYQVLGAIGDELGIDGVGIKPDDTFMFYQSCAETALCSSDEVFEQLSLININQAEVLGGFIFASNRRDSAFFGKPDVDTDSFANNFPNASIAGVYCSEEIGRTTEDCSTTEEKMEQSCGRSTLHVYSSVYLVITYVNPTGSASNPMLLDD